MIPRISLFIPLLALLSSCFKEDDRVLPHDPGNVQTDVAAMGQLYDKMVFYDLGTASPVLEKGKMDWDLAFGSGPGEWRIWLNTSRFMKVAATGTTDMSMVKDTVGLTWRFDKSDGDPDSTGFGTWFDLVGTDTMSKQEVYVIDLGFTSTGTPLGLRKLKVTGYDGTAYTITYARLDGTDERQAKVNKVQDLPMAFFSLINHQAVSGAWPVPGTWDLWFTQYTTLLYTNEGDPYPYIVTGVLTNYRDGVKVAVDTTQEFAAIDFDFAQGLEYSTAADRIGYDWKWYDFNATSYTVLPGINYLVRTTEGYFFKLRFIGFYNQQGEKGYPTFEFQQL
ncbi:MAG TPA: HmuY family protein [Bacteroidales bacterium]|nr:HmuY family protein [Bacteroidales bacterium]HRZ76037.1 HmuY family protein [Bacteroidales bacterium]